MHPGRPGKRAQVFAGARANNAGDRASGIGLEDMDQRFSLHLCANDRLASRANPYEKPATIFTAETMIQIALAVKLRVSSPEAILLSQRDLDRSEIDDRRIESQFGDQSVSGAAATATSSIANRSCGILASTVNMAGLATRV